MAANPILPRAQAPITGAQPTTREWYEFFRQLLLFVGETTQTGQVIQSILDRLTALEDAEGEDGIILGIDSVTVFGTLADGVVTIRLQNDSSTPGNSYAYGTNAEGLKGWWALADAFDVAPDELTKAVDPVTGITTYGLADVPDAGGGTLQKTAFDAKGRKTGTSAATTDDLPEGATNLYFTNARADARIELQKGQPNGLATLDGAGKLDGGQLPALAITETFVVADEAAMLALTAQQGDVAVRADIDTTYILTAEPASTLANWQELLSPTAGAVTSFNGRTGAVVPQSGDYTPAQVGAEPSITAGTTAQYWRGDKTWQTLNKAAVGLGNVDNTSDVDKPISTAQQTALDGKAIKSQGALVSMSANQSLPSGVTDAVSFDTEAYDDSGYHSGANPTRLTVSAAGRYVVSFVLAIQGSASGVRLANVAKNGGGFTGRAIQRVLPNGAGTDYITATSAPIPCAAGDYFELMANQTSGASLSITSGPVGTWFSITRVD